MGVRPACGKGRPTRRSYGKRARLWGPAVWTPPAASPAQVVTAGSSRRWPRTSGITTAFDRLIALRKFGLNGKPRRAHTCRSGGIRRPPDMADEPPACLTQRNVRSDLPTPSAASRKVRVPQSQPSIAALLPCCLSPAARVDLEPPLSTQLRPAHRTGAGKSAVRHRPAGQDCFDQRGTQLRRITDDSRESRSLDQSVPSNRW